MESQYHSPYEPLWHHEPRRPYESCSHPIDSLWYRHPIDYFVLWKLMKDFTFSTKKPSKDLISNDIKLYSSNWISCRLRLGKPHLKWLDWFTHANMKANYYISLWCNKKGKPKIIYNQSFQIKSKEHKILLHPFLMW